MSPKKTFVISSIVGTALLIVFGLSKRTIQEKTSRTESKITENSKTQITQPMSPDSSVFNNLRKNPNLLDKFNYFSDSLKRDEYQGQTVRGAVYLRLEEKYARAPTEAEIDKELERFEEIIARTDEHIFDRAAVGFESIMDKEKHNKQWEEEVNKYLHEKMIEEAISVADIRDVDCTERLCRLSFAHKNDEDRDAFINNYAASLGVGSNGAQVFTERTSDEQDNPETNLYITKKGEPLILVDVREALDNELNQEKNQEGEV